MVKQIWNRIRSGIDVEMWQKGWWMLLLILGTIAILFVINWLMILKYGGHS